MPFPQIRPEDARVRDTEYSFKHHRKQKHKDFPYEDPCPTSMRGVRLEDLATVAISWRMLTMLRPKNRLEEDIFSRLVELGKLRVRTRQTEQKHTQAQGPNYREGIMVFKSKRGVAETRIKICQNCGLEQCCGTICKEYPYDNFTRMIVDNDGDETDKEGGAAGQRRPSKGKNKGKGKKLSLTGAKKGPGQGTGKPGTKRKKKKKKNKASNDTAKPVTSPELSDEE